ncbi:MAG: DUF4105 domain-containing protein [Paludibacteraceae bacterium]|nr:DUF4105 domain-containing protein [Paludibacteraceae bacterium]
MLNGLKKYRGVIRFLFFLLYSIGSCGSVSATQISLLTSMPSERAVFTLWGHTAIRVKTEATDEVYNYGVFEFKKDFIYKFVKGETDYWLEKESMGYAILEAVYKNVYMYEQVLDITEEEALMIKEKLEENAKEENKFYRYNFFYDNCATRPRDLIEKVLGPFQYPTLNNQDSYRDKIHQLTVNNPWLMVGIDFCLGRETDEVVKDYDLMFLPYYMMVSYEGTNRLNPEGVYVPLIKNKKVMNTPEDEPVKSHTIFLHPVFLFSLFLLLMIACTIIQYKRKSESYLVDAIVYPLYGVFGVLIFFLTFISTHPCTNPNFNLLWCNPLQLLMPIFCYVPVAKKILRPYLWLNLVMCSLALIGWNWLWQEFHIAFLPLIMVMIIRSSYLLFRRMKEKNRL